MQIWIVVRDDSPCRRLGGRSLLGRILATLSLAGAERATVIVAPEGRLADVPEADVPLRHRVIDGSAPAPKAAGRVLVIEANRVYDPLLLETMVGQPAGTRLWDGDLPVGIAVIGGAGVDPAAPALAAVDRAVESIPPAGRLQLDDIPAERPRLRRSLRPWWVRVRDAATARQARRRLAEAAGKGTMEWLVVLLNRPLERQLSYHLAETRISPNQITVLANVIAYVAAALLATGRAGAGLGLALVAQIADGLDGRQARIQLRFSPAGRLEHVFDKAFEVAWMAALTWHLSAGGARVGVVAAGAVWVAATFAANLAGSAYRDRRGVLPEQESRVDARIRLLGFRRNTSMAILFVGWAAGLLMPAFWLVVCGAAVTAIVVQARTWLLLGRPAGHGTAAAGGEGTGRPTRG